jgi:hypothetical protein
LEAAVRSRHLSLFIGTALLAGTAGRAEADVKVEKVECLGFPSCYRLANETAEVVVTTDVGPRVIAYRLSDRANVFRESPTRSGPKNEWRSYGGHRLWAAPEARPRTYAPDNDPVGFHIDMLAGTIELTAPLETSTGLEKRIDVTLAPQGADVTVRHVITNRGPWPITLAPWAVTVMKGGGIAIVPQEPARPQPEALLPVRSMAVWAYTDMSDPRLRFGRTFVRLRSDAAAKAALKIGFGNREGWAAYHVDGTLFVKRFAYEPDATYPDLGSNLELFTAGGMLEVESLAPLRTLAPGQSAEHVERWSLHGGVALPDADDALDALLRPLVAE